MVTVSHDIRYCSENRGETSESTQLGTVSRGCDRKLYVLKFTEEYRRLLLNPLGFLCGQTMNDTTDAPYKHVEDAGNARDKLAVTRPSLVENLKIQNDGESTHPPQTVTAKQTIYNSAFIPAWRRKQIREQEKVRNKRYGSGNQNKYMIGFHRWHDHKQAQNDEAETNGCRGWSQPYC